jgi:hypothetical protein
VVGLYFRHDVLSLHRSNPQPSSLRAGCSESPTRLPLSAYFNPTHASTPHPLQQAAARFVNTLASLRCGRDYLCSAGCKVLRVLVPCLRGDKGIRVDSVTTDMILAALQKLSLRCDLIVVEQFDVALTASKSTHSRCINQFQTMAFTAVH